MERESKTDQLSMDGAIGLRAALGKPQLYLATVTLRGISACFGPARRRGLDGLADITCPLILHRFQLNPTAFALILVEVPWMLALFLRLSS